MYCVLSFLNSLFVSFVISLCLYLVHPFVLELVLYCVLYSFVRSSFMDYVGYFVR